MDELDGLLERYRLVTGRSGAGKTGLASEVARRAAARFARGASEKMHQFGAEIPGHCRDGLVIFS